MAQSLDDVLSALTPEQRARVEARAQELIEEELTLRDLRQGVIGEPARQYQPRSRSAGDTPLVPRPSMRR